MEQGTMVLIKSAQADFLFVVAVFHGAIEVAVGRVVAHVAAESDFVVEEDDVVGTFVGEGDPAWCVVWRVCGVPPNSFSQENGVGGTSGCPLTAESSKNDVGGRKKFPLTAESNGNGVGGTSGCSLTAESSKNDVGGRKKFPLTAESSGNDVGGRKKFATTP